MEKLSVPPKIGDLLPAMWRFIKKAHVLEALTVKNLVCLCLFPNIFDHITFFFSLKKEPILRTSIPGEGLIKS